MFDPTCWPQPLACAGTLPLARRNARGMLGFDHDGLLAGRGYDHVGAQSGVARGGLRASQRDLPRGIKAYGRLILALLALDSSGAA